jgi:hypothetical protein
VGDIPREAKLTPRSGGPRVWDRLFGKFAQVCLTALLRVMGLLGRLLAGGGRAGFVLAGVREQWQGEPDELAVWQRGDPPVLSERLDDLKPPSRLLPGRWGARDGLAWAVIAHLHADLVPRAVDRELEVATGVSHAVGGKLGGHQLRGFHGLAWLVAQEISDKVACAGHGLGLAVKVARVGHGSIENTLERPVVSNTR